MTIITNLSGKVWLSLKSRLDEWTECQIQYPNQVYAPTAKDRFIIAQYITTEYGGQIPINAECGQPINGILNLSVLVPIKWDFSQHIGLASRIADHFGPKDTYTYADITTKIRARSRVIGPSQGNPPWNRLEVQAYWTAWG